MAFSPEMTVVAREWVAMPDFGIACIQATLDPGSEVSMLRVFEVCLRSEDGVLCADFVVRPIAGDDRTSVRAEAPLAGGTSNRRGGDDPVVRTLVTLGEETWPIDLVLVSRDPQEARLVLGSRALRGRVAVDPTRTFMAGPPALLAMSS